MDINRIDIHKQNIIDSFFTYNNFEKLFTNVHKFTELDSILFQMYEKSNDMKFINKMINTHFK